MALNPSIILGGQQPDFVNVLARSGQAAAQNNAVQDQNALRDVYRQHGQGIAAGDQSALNALAQLNPEASLGIQQGRQNIETGALNQDATRLNMEGKRQSMGILSEQHQMAVQQHMAGLSAGQRAQEADQIRQGLMQGVQLHQRGDLAGINSILSQAGMEPIASLDEFPAIAVQYQGVLEAMESVRDFNKGPQREFAVTDGQFYDKNNPAAGAQAIPGYVEPVKKPLVDMSGANFGPQGSGVGDKFYDEVDKGQAAMFTGLIDDGVGAPAKLAQIDQLEGLLVASPSGAEAAFKSYLGSYGVQTEGLDTLQAAEAIISQLVPAQRPPGSGTMSDADLALFKQSLPRLVNTPEGNRQIITAIRGIALYQKAQSEIANAVVSREMAPAEGRAALMALENPLQAQRREGTAQIGGGYTIKEVK